MRIGQINTDPLFALSDYDEYCMYLSVLNVKKTNKIQQQYILTHAYFIAFCVFIQKMSANMNIGYTHM